MRKGHKIIVLAQLTPPLSAKSKISFRPQKILKLSATKLTIQQSQPLPKTLTPLTTKSKITIALSHLRSSNPQLEALIDFYDPPSFEFDHPPFQSLSCSILYKQLATKAAQCIYPRFLTLCGGEDSLRPQTLLSLSTQNVWTLSNSSILKMDNESLLTMLSVVKGIGAWSVQMFTIFSLKRPDVLLVRDLGVRKAVKFFYGLKELPKPLEMEELCEKWRREERKRATARVSGEDVWRR